MRWGIVTVCLVVGCSTPKKLELDRTPEPAGASEAPVLQAMRAELDRSFTQLKAQGRSAPYFLAYQVSEVQVANISSELGALLASDDLHARRLDVDVRVGDPKLDNTHSLRDRGSYAGFSRLSRTSQVAIEDDVPALRASLWLATDERYKDAVERLVKIKSERAIDVQDEDNSDDFSVEKPGMFLGAPAKLVLDRGAWEARTRELSKLFRARPEILQGKVDLRVLAETRYMTSSEGAVLQRGSTNARVTLVVQAKADDGMDLQLMDTADASSVDKLPDQAALSVRAKKLMEQLIALRTAPVADAFVGPAILDGRAASVFFHETFGHRVEGHRQKDDDEGQTFAKKINHRVMPEFIDVWDDPSVRALNGIELNGSYPFDDEGIAGQRVSLVSKGVLSAFLMSRSPARGFVRSNGHGRRSPGEEIVARQGNLVVEPARVYTPEKLKKMLLEEVAKQGKPYGLRLAEVDGGYTTTMREQIQAFKVRPVIVYRVYPDGREELVRGVDLEGTPLASLETIVAAGNDFSVFNGFCGAESGSIPVSASSPSLLVGQLEVARKEKSHDKPPILPPPGFDTVSAQAGAR
jgi:TldD protein